MAKNNPAGETLDVLVLSTLVDKISTRQVIYATFRFKKQHFTDILKRERLVYNIKTFRMRQ